MASGSAPLTPEVQSYMKSIMCCPLIEGYGQTESSGGVFYSTEFDTNYGQFAEIAVKFLLYSLLFKSSFVTYQKCTILQRTSIKTHPKYHQEEKFGSGGLKSFLDTINKKMLPKTPSHLTAG